MHVPRRHRAKNGKSVLRVGETQHVSMQRPRVIHDLVTNCESCIASRTTRHVPRPWEPHRKSEIKCGEYVKAVVLRNLTVRYIEVPSSIQFPCHLEGSLLVAVKVSCEPPISYSSFCGRAHLFRFKLSFVIVLGRNVGTWRLNGGGR